MITARYLTNGQGPFASREVSRYFATLKSHGKKRIDSSELNSGFETRNQSWDNISTKTSNRI